MISCDRIAERPPYLATAPQRDREAYTWCYSTLRQGLYQYFRSWQPSAVLLPDFVPEGIYDPFRRLGWNCAFYGVDASLRPDMEEFRRCLETVEPAVVVCIHYFGIVTDAARLMRDAMPGDAILIEDFAHALPADGCIVTGDIATFSFPKMVGVADGAPMVFANPRLARTPVYTAAGPEGRELARRMAWRLRADSFCRTWAFNSTVEMGVRRVLGERVRYYTHLVDHYPSIGSPASARSMQVLGRLDFEAIREKRARLAAIYRAGLRRSCLLDVSDGAYAKGALFAFPVAVEDPQRLHARLLEQGVRGLRLADRWWHDPSRPHSDLYLHHYLLPLNHYLEEHDVRTVARCVNAALGTEGL
jgi:dTDP-4-amino-4,6-dideoxygalactose transaminase